MGAWRTRKTLRNTARDSTKCRSQFTTCARATWWSWTLLPFCCLVVCVCVCACVCGSRCVHWFTGIHTCYVCSLFNPAHWFSRSLCCSRMWLWMSDCRFTQNLWPSTKVMCLPHYWFGHGWCHTTWCMFCAHHTVTYQFTLSFEAAYVYLVF